MILSLLYTLLLTTYYLLLSRHGGWMILSLLYTFCMRLGVPVAHNQNQAP
jgi:hypothetical protein